MVKIKTIIKKKVNKTICVHKTELTACSMAVACLHKKTNTNFSDNANKVNKQKVSLEFHAYIVQHCTFVINLGQSLLNAEVLFVYYWKT